MPIVKTISPKDGLIGIWKITEEPEDLEKYFQENMLKTSPYSDIKNSQRQKEWLATRLLLTELSSSDSNIIYTREGKPELQNSTYKYISISHSGNFAIIYLHKKLPVGIDIECLSRNYQRIAGKYLSDQEINQVANDTTLLCLYWCTKEAIFKLVKDNGIDFRKQIHILPFDPKQSNALLARFTIHNEKTYYQLKFEAIEDYFMVWVENEPIDY